MGMFFRSVVDRGIGRRRQNAFPADPCARFPLGSLLEGYQCIRLDEHISYGSTVDTVPPFGLAFSSAGHMHNVLAAANEEGIVRIYDTDSRANPLLKEWLAHENAVFDIAWVPGEPQLVTAAGDQMARLWDVNSGEPLGSFKGHLCSLKSVAFAPGEKAVFCTGGRDGNIMVWDIRCSQKDGFYKQVKQITGAHNKSETNPPSKMKKRRSSMRGMAPSVDTQQSVTVVLFRDRHTLVSSGAVDGVIKMWDLRKNYTGYRNDPVSMETYPYAGSSSRMRLGYSGLVLDSSRSNIMCNCTDDNIYMFNLCGTKTTPVAVFSGHQNSSFYVKSTISPDDQFLASGSSDNNTYIWKISDPQHPPITLQGHAEEVTSVAWCPTDFTKIASCSDDHTIRIWRLRRETEESSLEGANLVGWARSKPPTMPSVRVGTSPVSTQTTKSIGGLASPQPAACAPNKAALPHPSSTSSPNRPKPISVQHTTAVSIQEWLSPTRGSPSRVTVGTPPHRALRTCPMSATSSTSPSERRDKRRLETDESSPSSCEDVADFECASKHYPAAKRSRVLFNACRSAQECLIQTDSQTEDSEPVTSKQAGKENWSPIAGNWLSEMGEKIRKSQGGSSAHRKQDGKTSSSTLLHSPKTKKISMYFTKRPQE